MAGSGTTEGYIYFITADYPDYPIKIGFTELIKNTRIKGLQTGCPYQLQVIGRIRGTVADERKIHADFDHIRLEGEWFRKWHVLRWRKGPLPVLWRASSDAVRLSRCRFDTALPGTWGRKAGRSISCLPAPGIWWCELDWSRRQSQDERANRSKRPRVN